ncbi:late competence development ComFB family protein [Paratissierella segnis]|jgi:competence protein ComFB|uniref:Late competence development ComFB family protein n=1 Tax=Paratissierella segnis TaxID=2763679 RepID=A0A926IJS3_9FIRM|nr:late competence development ComFB family protein [Paratissierella segnis]MBC8587550.1 late competence development ComFB family protein [Paratissierella segnis]
MTGIILKNYMEEIVFSVIDDVLKDMDICRCERCKMDIIAISLNNLPSKYVVTERGELYSKVNLFKMQVEVDVITEITKAAMIVKRNPNH